MSKEPQRILGRLFASNKNLDPQTTIYKWLFQLIDSQSLHRKWLFHQTSICKWLFRVPGTYPPQKKTDFFHILNLKMKFFSDDSPKKHFGGAFSGSKKSSFSGGGKKHVSRIFRVDPPKKNKNTKGWCNLASTCCQSNSNLEP